MKLRSQMSKQRQGSPGYNSVKRRALQLLKQKKLYEGQLEQAMNVDFNMSGMQMAVESMEMTKANVAAMKGTVKEFKKTMKAFNVTDMEVRSASLPPARHSVCFLLFARLTATE